MTKDDKLLIEAEEIAFKDVKDAYARMAHHFGTANAAVLTHAYLQHFDNVVARLKGGEA